MHGLEELLLLGQGRGRPLAGLGAGQRPGRGQEKSEKDGGLAMFHAGLQEGIGREYLYDRPGQKARESGFPAEPRPRRRRLR